MHRVQFWGSKGSKYKNISTEFNGERYDSKLEARVAADLELRRKAGDITEIKRQVTFPLVVNGIKICSYRADFVVTDKDGQKEIVEAKGIMFPISRMKMLLVEALFYPEYKITIVKQ